MMNLQILGCFTVLTTVTIAFLHLRFPLFPIWRIARGKRGTNQRVSEIFPQRYAFFVCMPHDFCISGEQLGRFTFCLFRDSLVRLINSTFLLLVSSSIASWSSSSSTWILLASLQDCPALYSLAMRIATINTAATVSRDAFPENHKVIVPSRNSPHVIWVLLLSSSTLVLEDGLLNEPYACVSLNAFSALKICPFTQFCLSDSICFSFFPSPCRKSTSWQV